MRSERVERKCPERSDLVQALCFGAQFRSEVGMRDADQLVDPIANRFQIVGVEVVPDIFDQFLDCQRDFVTAGHEGMRAAAVLWRRSALATDAARIDAFLLQHQARLHAHLMFPSIVQIVFVEKPFVDTKAEIAQLAP